MLSFKLLLISTIVLSTAVVLKFSVPAITDFAVYEVPSIYNGVVSWLRPPYLFLVINCIIITIVASSKLQSRKDDDLSLSPPLKPLEPMVSQRPQTRATMVTVESINQTDETPQKIMKKAETFNDRTNTRSPLKSPGSGGGSTAGKLRREPSLTHHELNRRMDELNRQMDELNRLMKAFIKMSLKKWDTLERDTHAHHQQEETPQKIMNKAETFNDRINTRSPLMKPGSSGDSTSRKLRRELSLTHDESIRREEAFIKKMKESWRLERQKSLEILDTIRGIL